MTIFELALLAIEACEAEDVEHMLTGAFATSCYGIPRSTKDVDLVLSISAPKEIASIIERLSPHVEFDQQVQFDTLTWGKRQVGCTRDVPHLKVELFELFDDAFVMEQFKRKVRTIVGTLKKKAYVPTAEDVIVQKLRWARDKDLIDARDVIIVQEPKNLDMEYIRNWCRQHGSEGRLDETLAKVPKI
jgi:glycyl-tRNA synthetase alpha subunit